MSAIHRPPREFTLRVRQAGDEFTATLRPVVAGSTIDAVPFGDPVRATAANEFAAMIGAIANAHLPRVPAAVLKPATAQDTAEPVEAAQTARETPHSDSYTAMIHELFVLWPAWQEIVEYVSTAHPAEADVCSIYGAACAVDRDRLAALLYGRMIGDTLSEAGEILAEIMRGAVVGRRPRTGRELGITREMFGERS